MGSFLLITASSLFENISNLLLVTPFTSLLMGPAGAARAGRCGVRSANTGAQGRPESSGTKSRQGRGKAEAVGRAAETSRLLQGLHHLPRLPRLPRPRRLNVASSALSSASTSTQNKNTPHLPATPLLIGQSRPGLGTPGEGEERATAARDHPSPTTGAAPDGAPASSRSSAAAAAARPPPASKAGQPTRRRRGREVPKCLCVCVGGLWGGSECARARGLVWERKAGGQQAAREPPLLALNPSPLRRQTGTHQPTQNLSFRPSPLKT